jgi:hypothetical protein
VKGEVGGKCEPLSRVECTHCVSSSEKILIACCAMAQMASNTFICDVRDTWQGRGEQDLHSEYRLDNVIQIQHLGLLAIVEMILIV